MDELFVQWGSLPAGVALSPTFLGHSAAHAKQTGVPNRFVWTVDAIRKCVDTHVRGYRFTVFLVIAPIGLNSPRAHTNVLVVANNGGVLTCMFYIVFIYSNSFSTVYYFDSLPGTDGRTGLPRALNNALAGKVTGRRDTHLWRTNGCQSRFNDCIAQSLRFTAVFLDDPEALPTGFTWVADIIRRR